MVRVVCLVAILACSSLLYGQVITGSISGTVKDSSGAVLPGTAVQIRNTDTGVGRTVTTDPRGYYTASNISPGNYEVSATIAGFQTEVRQGIAVNVGQSSLIDFTLQVGAVTERVEVTAEAPLIETTNAVLTGLVTERQVEDLPLNARSLIELAPLQAGIVLATEGETSASKGMGAKLAIAGTRYNANLFQMDGADINDLGGAAGSASQNLMGAETIKEFNVVINAYSAEYGKHSGGVFNAVTKSGTNTLHGSAFEFLRNDALDAARWEDNKNSLEKNPFKRNQFGGSLGGPIVRDRTFFFGSYEGLRERLGNTLTFDVPRPELKQGIILGQNDQVVAQITPAATVQPYLNFYPAPSPNGLKSANGTQERYEQHTLPTNEDYTTVRGDHKISDKDSVFARYTYSEADKVESIDLVATNSNLSRNQSSTIGHTRIISSQWINQFLLSWARNNLADADAVIHEDAIPRLPATFRHTSHEGTIGGIDVDDLSNFSNEGIRNYLNMTYQAKNDLFYTAGSHSWKFGFNTQKNFWYALRHFNGQGDFDFDTMQDFLRGISSGFTALTRDSQPTTYIRNWLTGLYVQDDWRISPRLTLNMGLRYEFITVPQAEGGKVSTLRDFVTPGQTPDRLVLGNPPFLNPSLKNWAPRVGLAWDPTGSGKTSVRAGAGVFHDQINPGTFVFSLLSSLPFYNVGNIVPGNILTNSTFPNGVVVPNPSFPDAFYTQHDYLAGAGNIEGIQYIPEQPVIYKWSLEIQRELPGNLGVTLGYAGNRGLHLLRVVTMNSKNSTIVNDRRFLPNNATVHSPNFGRIRPRFTDTTSNYHGLLLTVKKRLSQGLQFQSAYTFSKTIDDNSNWTGSSDWGNSPAGGRYRDVKDRGLAAFDVRHAFSTNATYSLPGANLPGAAGYALGGWQLSSIVSLRGGNPNQPNAGVNPGGSGGSNLIQYTVRYPDQVAAVNYDTRNPDGYFDPTAFALPPGFVSSERTALGGVFIGNAARGSLTSPGSATVDLVLQKSFRVTERVNLNFRSEFYNLFNRVNFGNPSGSIFATNTIQPGGGRGQVNLNAGKITSTRGTPRQLQFGLRVEF